MTIRLQSTNAQTLVGLKILVYGGAGVGKTRLCASLPSPVVFSAEGGLLSLRRFNLPYVEVDSIAKLEELYAWTIGSREARQFQSVCLDSISDIAETVLTSERIKTRDPRKAYGEVVIQVIEKIKQFRRIANKHVYFTAKEEWAVDQQTGARYFSPSFPGKQLGQLSPYEFDEVFRLTIYKDQTSGKDFEVLQTRGDSNTIAKDRSGMLEYYEKYDLGYIINKIYQ